MTIPDLKQRLAQQQVPAGFPVMRQRWAELGFFHWTVSPDIVQMTRRLFYLPYQHARMSSKISDDTVEYYSRRKSHEFAKAEFKYPLLIAPKAAVIGSLEWFLLERYTLFSVDQKGNLHSGRVHHEPYQIEAMSHGECSALPFSLNGFAEPETPPVSLICANLVDVTVFPFRLHT
jgi:uncharacterized protein YqjF (DUF2071 family)